MAQVPALVSALADLFLPAHCPGCRAPGGGGDAGACAACLTSLAGAPAPRMPTPAPAGLPQTWAAAVYAGAARALLVAYKERGEVRLRRPLGAALARAVAGALSSPGQEQAGRTSVLLVPVPASREARRSRGSDPLDRLAAAAAGRLGAAGVPVRVGRLLSHRRAVADQAGLGARARAPNLAGALVAPPDRAARVPPGACVLVVDDVLTTGATLTEATRALTAARIRVSAAAVVAATPRRVPGPGPTAG